MSEHTPLLIEIGCEELPPKSLYELTDAFASGICAELSKRGIAADVANAKKYNSPRRLSVLVPNVSTAQPDQNIERRGPAVSAALDASGQPTKALLGFASSCGVSVDQLEKLQTDKGAWFVHRAQQAGKPIAALMQEIIAEALASLPIPKPMRWGDHDFAFVRPVHWLVVLHGEQVIDVEIFGIKSGRAARGHRFLSPNAFDVASADLYETLLSEKHFVIVDPASRRNRVSAAVEHAASRLQRRAIPRTELVAEISNLVEWPVAIACEFESEFLGIPQEALIQTMETNQKFVPVFGTDGKLTDHFIGIANIASKDPTEIRKGYERVIRPRFADAKFFYDT